MGKRLVKNVMTGLAILSALGVSATPVFADIPIGTVVFGDGTAFDLNYANTNAQGTAAVTREVVSGGKIWVNTYGGTLVNNSDGSTVLPSALPPALTYTDGTGAVSTISPTPTPPVTVTTVSAINSTVAVGGTTGFTFANSDGTVATPTGVVYSVTSANSATGFFNNGVFTATAAGAYTIQAAVGTTNLTTTVTAVGIASGIKLAADNTTLVANNKSRATITASVLDSNNNTVTNFNGTVALAISANGGALVDVNGATVTKVTFVNGVGTFYVLGPTAVPSPANDIVTPSTLVSTNGVGIASSINYQPLTINYAAQTGQTLKVTPATATYSSNDGTSYDVVTVKECDTNGVPLTSSFSSYVSLTLSGPGSFSQVSVGNPATTTTTLYMTGNSSGNTVNVYPIQGQSGTITLTATSTGMTTGTNTITTLATGVPATLAFSGATSTAIQGSALTAGVTYTLYTMQLADASGNPVAVPSSSSDVLTISDNSASLTTPGTLNYYSVDSNGQPTGSGWTANASSQYTQSMPSTGILKFAVTNSTVGSSASTLSVTDSLTSATKTASYAYVVGTPTTIALPSGSATAVNLAPGASNTVTVQLKDASSNKAAVAGKTVNFYFGTNTAAGTMNGSSAWTSSNPYAVTTDSNGIASVPVTIPSTASAASTCAVTAAFNGNTQTVTDTVVPIASVGSGLVLGITQVSGGGGTPTAATWPTNASLVAGTSLDNIVSGALTSVSSGTQSSLYANLVNAIGADVTGVPSGTADYIAVATSDPTILGLTQVGSWTTNTSSNSKITSVKQLVTNQGVQLPEIQALKAGSATITITDLNNPNVPAKTFTISVTSGVATQSLIYNSGALLTSSNKLTVVANTAVALTVANVDAAGNLVPVATSNQTVALNDSTGQFRATQSGASVTYATIPVGSTSTTVYYVNQNSGTYDVSADAVLAGQGIAVSNGSITAGSSANFTITLGSGNGSNATETLPVTITGAPNSPGGTAPVLPTSLAFSSGTTTAAITLYNAANQTLTFNVAGMTKTVSITGITGPSVPSLGSGQSVTTGGAIVITSLTNSCTAWIAPANTTSFTAGTTMTKVTGNGTTSILAPTVAGTYYEYIVDQWGNPTTASTNSVTVHS